MLLKKIYFAVFLTVLAVLTVQAQVDSNFHCYLLFGQSNMAGGGAGVPLGGSGSGTLNTADCDTSTQVKVLAFSDCSAAANTACKKYTQNRTADNWYTAYPPLHIAGEGVSPGDWFAKTMLDSIRDGIKLGLIPCALSGQALSVFVKGGSNFNIPNWAHPTLANKSPYDWMLARCQLAQKTGVIKGILLHQGESGAGGKAWGDVAKQICDDLKKDLGLPSTTPVIVGELRQDSKACCAGANKDIDNFATTYPNCGLASSLNLAVQTDNSDGTTDPYHFNPEGMRELGKRYAQAFLKLADNKYVPRKGSVEVITPKVQRAVSTVAVNAWKNEANIFTLDGKLVSSLPSSGAMSDVRPGSVYLVKRNHGTDVHLMVVP
jgi:hypothetical protein